MSLHFETLSRNQLDQNWYCSTCVTNAPDNLVAHRMANVWHAFHRDCLPLSYAGNAICPLCERAISQIDDELLADGFQGVEYSLSVKEFLEDEAIPLEEALSTGLRFAARRGKLIIVKELLARGNTSVENRSKAVCHAAGEGHTEIVHELLADGEIENAAFQRAIQYAADAECKNTLKELLEKNHNLTTNEQLENAIQQAARIEDWDLFTTLTDDLALRNL